MRYVMRSYLFANAYTMNRRRKSKALGKSAGGSAGESFRFRLQVLVDKAGSARAFAKQLRGGFESETDYSPRVSEWLHGRQLPGWESLRLIRERFAVGGDWLLGVEGAFQHPDQGRSDATLAADLFAYVSREARTRIESEWLDDLQLALLSGKEGRGLLDDVVNRELERRVQNHRLGELETERRGREQSVWWQALKRNFSAPSAAALSEPFALQTAHRATRGAPQRKTPRKKAARRRSK